MSIWIFLWLVLSCVLLYFLCWTLYILYFQKKAWKAFAKKRGLRYKANRLLDPPELSGTINDYTVNVFTAEHESEDARGSRAMTAIEIQLNSLLPFEGAIASGGMVDLVKNLDLNHEIKPVHEKWKKSYTAKTNYKTALMDYLSEGRLTALLSLMALQNAWVIFVFKEDITLLRLDTPSPLQKEKTVDALIGKLIKTAKVMELREGEATQLKSKKLVATSQQDVLWDKDDKDLDQPVKFELEEDEVEAEAEGEEDAKD